MKDVCHWNDIEIYSILHVWNMCGVRNAFFVAVFILYHNHYHRVFLALCFLNYYLRVKPRNYAVNINFPIESNHRLRKQFILTTGN